MWEIFFIALQLNISLTTYEDPIRDIGIHISMHKSENTTYVLLSSTEISSYDYTLKRQMTQYAEDS